MILARLEKGQFHALWYGGSIIPVYNMYTGEQVYCFTLPDKQGKAYRAREVLSFIKERLTTPLSEDRM